jgi:hypothetical protein
MRSTVLSSPDRGARCLPGRDLPPGLRPFCGIDDRPGPWTDPQNAPPLHGFTGSTSAWHG